jgi:hypothetical protein
MPFYPNHRSRQKKKDRTFGDLFSDLAGKTRPKNVFDKNRAPGEWKPRSPRKKNPSLGVAFSGTMITFTWPRG